MAKRRTFLNYIGIALAVFIGVAAARLGVLFVLADVVEQQIENIAEQAQQSSKRIQENAVRQQAERQRTTEHQRMTSKIGQDLFRRCKEYSDFYRSSPGDYAKEQRDKTCTKYKTYVSTGHQTP